MSQPPTARTLPVPIAAVLAVSVSLFAVTPARAATQLPTRASPTGASSEALLSSVVDALAADDRHRSAKLSKVAAISDPRSVVVLTYIAQHDAHVAAAQRAVGGLGLLARSGRPEALGALDRLGRDFRPPVAEEALKELATLAPNPTAFDRLLAVARDDNLPSERRRLSIELLSTKFAAQSEKTGLPRLSGPASLPVLGGALMGGYAFSVLGRFRSDGAETLGWLTGAFVGGGTGFLFGREMTLDRQAWYLSGMWWGVWSGELLARATVKDSSHSTNGAFGIGGQLLGFAAAWALEEQLNLTASDTLFVDVSTLSGLLFGYGMTEVLYKKLGERGRAGMMTGTTLGWMAVAAAVAKNVTLTPGDVALQTFGAVEGWWYGMWIGDVLHKSRSERESEFFAKNADVQPGPNGVPQFKEFVDDDPDQFVNDASVGGMWLGAGLGYIAATVISQHVDLERSDVTQMFVFGAYGKLLGAGIASLASEDGNVQMGGSLALGAIGIGVGALATSDMNYSAGDLSLVPIATAWGFFHGTAVGLWLDDRKVTNKDQSVGIILSTGALFGIGAIAVTQELELTTLQSTMATTGAFWGAWLAGWGASLKVKDGNDAMLAAAIGGDVGAAVSALMISPVFDVDPLILAGASFGGLSLAGVVSLLTYIQTDDADTITSANLAGSVVGLVGGGWLTARWLDGRRPTRRAARRLDGSRSARASMSLDDSTSLDWVRGVHASPLMQNGAMTGVTLQLAGSW